MTAIDRSALLPHSAERLYDLVADIEAYPQFLDGCVGSEILARSASTVTARLSLSRAGLTQSFVTQNVMTPHEQIELTLVDGPFDKFAGRWIFKALAPDACKVSLSLAFTLRSGLIGVAAGRLFDRVALDLVDAIVARAEVLYGKGSV
jgi:ribosome-associated toxin RatA of RatAB toxin-antitoxin module